MSHFFLRSSAVTGNAKGDVSDPSGRLASPGYLSPVPKFTITGEQVTGKPLTFRNLSSAGAGAIVHSLWDFGQASAGSSTMEDVEFTYSAPGVYSVTLVVWNTSGVANSFTTSVKVAGP